MVGSISELFNSSEIKAAELLRRGDIGRSGGGDHRANSTLILLPFLAHLRHRLRVSYCHQRVNNLLQRYLPLKPLG